MTKVFRCLTVLTISAAFATASIALAQMYTTIDYPGAIATTLDGGPNPERTNIGTWTDTAAVTHGFVLKDDVFTLFDVPGLYRDDSQLDQSAGSCRGRLRRLDSG